jgi:hypothetical protein
VVTSEWWNEENGWGRRLKCASLRLSIVKCHVH